MEPAVGTTLVHPQHGTTTVTGFETRTIKGSETRYIVLERPEDHLTVRIPADQFAAAGLRPVITADDVADVLDAMGDGPDEGADTWRQRHARNEKRVHSGEANEIARALRDLHARYEADGLSTTDLRLYREARERLVDEIVAATGKSRDDVDADIATSLAQAPSPS